MLSGGIAKLEGNRPGAWDERPVWLVLNRPTGESFPEGDWRSSPPFKRTRR